MNTIYVITYVCIFQSELYERCLNCTWTSLKIKMKDSNQRNYFDCCLPLLNLQNGSMNTIRSHCVFSFTISTCIHLFSSLHTCWGFPYLFFSLFCCISFGCVKFWAFRVIHSIFTKANKLKLNRIRSGEQVTSSLDLPFQFMNWAAHYWLTVVPENFSYAELQFAENCVVWIVW